MNSQQYEQEPTSQQAQVAVHDGPASTEHWVPILVRAEHYLEAAAWVAQRENASDVDRTDVAAAQRIKAEVQLGSEKFGAWPLENLVKLAKATERKTDWRWATAMDLASALPETPLSTSELARRSGMSTNEWRDAQRKFQAKHFDLHYGGQRN